MNDLIDSINNEISLRQANDKYKVGKTSSVKSSNDKTSVSID